jgi:hypothetical protein
MKNVPKPEPHDLKIGRSRLKPTPQEPIQNFKPSFVPKPGQEVLFKMSLLVRAFGSHSFCNIESTHTCLGGYLILSITTSSSLINDSSKK